MAQLQFSTQGIDTESRFDALPPGEYTVVVSESDMRENSKGTGVYLALTMDVQAPDRYRGRKLWANLNVSHQSAKAQEIGQQQLAQLIKACGFEGITDSEQIHHIPVNAIVKVRKDDNTQNEVKGFKPAAGQPQLHAVPGQQAPAQQAPAQQAMPTQAAPQQQFAQPAQQPPAQPVAQPTPPQQPAAPAMATPPWMNQG